MKTTGGIISISILATVLFSTAGPVTTAAAGPELWASVKTTAECSLSGSDLTVTVGWVRVKEDTPDPLISHETITLEQRVANEWVPAGVLFDGDFTGNPHSHTGFVNLLEGAKSLRVTVVLTVDNANPKRPGGTAHAASCDSKIE